MTRATKESLAPSRAYRIVPLAVFGAILLHGAWLGLTDDEAYYWVLAQRPSAGYAYHPPGVAIAIALSQALFGWLAGPASALVVRLPAAFCAAAMVALGMGWVAKARPAGERTDPRRSALALLSVAGIFALSWMMVPDLPLFLFWTLAFRATWDICFEREGARGSRYAWLGMGIAGAILSKYSGVLAAVSAFGAILAWAPKERRARGIGAVIAGGALAAAPILYWNATHEWVSILYQVRDRHGGGGGVSLARYARFWAIEWVIAGPALAVSSMLLAARWVRGRAERPESFALAWAAPGAAVFFAQPLWSDFKPHWALIVWWPLALALAWSFAREGCRGGSRSLGRAQVAYGLGLGALVLASCHAPLMAWARERFGGGGAADPRLDVTNDLYGWGELRAFIAEKGGAEAASLPILASRYQTASQAAFAMGARAGGSRGAPVTMLPRDLRAMDEWPALDVADGQGPEWPRLLKPVLFVADNRYEDGPAYVGASCRREWTLESRRWGRAAKTIYVWRCDPAPAQ